MRVYDYAIYMLALLLRAQYFCVQNAVLHILPDFDFRIWLLHFWFRFLLIFLVFCILGAICIIRLLPERWHYTSAAHAIDGPILFP